MKLKTKIRLIKANMKLEDTNKVLLPILDENTKI